VKLVVLEGPAARPSFEVSEPTTLIGRAPDCDVLVFDAQVSRHHAQIVRVGSEHFLESLQEANPAIVNDRIVTTRRRLIDGDLIILGGVVMEVDIPPPTSGASPDDASLDDASSNTDAMTQEIVERRTPRAQAMPPEPPLVVLKSVATRLGEAGRRMQARASTRTDAKAGVEVPTVEGIVVDHERLGGDPELARLAGVLSERLSNQTDIRALYRLGAEAAMLIAWLKLSQRSLDEAVRLAELLGAH
jgi:pSer/pThr/pTyr-binding forkhead associated (FHA) protein